MPFKHLADRHHRIPKQPHRATNWAAYDASLRGRGSLTVWFSEAAIAAWRAEPRTTCGGQPRYSTHGLPIGQVDPAVGIATGLGLLFGSIARGYASAVTARRSLRAPHLFCAAVCALVAPSFALTLWLPSVTLALLLTGVSTCLVGMLAPFIFADIQAICDPTNRPRTVATAMTLVTIGLYAVIPPWWAP